MSTSEWFGPSPPPELISHEPPPKLLSQGAEARVWLVDISSIRNDDATDAPPIKANVSVGSGINAPKLYSLSQLSSVSKDTDNNKMIFICKERFSKKYRHPQLDVSLTKSRTKAEARCLIRCKKADVPCPTVFGIGQWSASDGKVGERNSGTTNPAAASSSCLFLEHINGCTIRHYFEERSNPATEKSELTGEPHAKRARCEEDPSDSANSDTNQAQVQDRITTKIDSHTLVVAHTLGTLVAKMHAAGIIHGDLTTSNIMLRNPSWTSAEDNDNNSSWEPQLVLIDFGLATSTAPVQVNNNNNNKQNKQQHNAEDKAVDLYVLERAFLSTHPESEMLVEQVWKGYQSHYQGMDDESEMKTEDVGDTNSIGAYSCVANSVMNRLEQVRLRGRKREYFG
ncbi:hypothetical protein ACHAWO_013925 [Cyclotella atomus]|uniref:non-specific serine/threonine protein kinase n=1 Tax=Cyclotella atomus TaxID=382360 RepID=A0ABD3PN62_9STRA